MRYQSRPIEIEAFQYEGSLEPKEGYHVPKWVIKAYEDEILYYDNRDRLLLCKERENIHVPKHDFIIKNIMGELEICKERIFKATYKELGIPTYNHSLDGCNRDNDIGKNDCWHCVCFCFPIGCVAHEDSHIGNMIPRLKIGDHVIDVYNGIETEFIVDGIDYESWTYFAINNNLPSERVSHYKSNKIYFTQDDIGKTIFSKPE